MKLDKGLVGLAAEFAVASELARRNVYAQPTFGHLKRTDLLIMKENGKLLRIEVKGKQGDSWPNCKGISNDQSILVLVDLSKKETDRPDFYILSVADWIELADQKIQEGKEKNPNGWSGAQLRKDDNVPVFYNQRTKSGRYYEGLGLNVKDVAGFKERWDKIISY